MYTPESPMDMIPGTIFEDWRTYQRETVEWIAEEFLKGRKYVAIDGPTGYGKSLTGVMAGKVLKARTLYLCHSKQLQDQIAADFSDHCAVLKGKSNYPCLQCPGVAADLCSHDSKTPCKYAGKRDRDYNWVRLPQCPYKVAKIEALRAPLLVANYALFLNEANYVGGLSDWPLLVIDEADMTDNALTGHLTLDINTKDLETYKLDPPDFPDELESWTFWVPGAILAVDEVFQLYMAEINEATMLGVSPSTSSQKSAKRAKTFLGKLKTFSYWVDSQWIMDADEYKGTWSFKPKWADRIANSLMMRHSPRILAMSGTMPIPELWGPDLGISAKDIGFQAIPSTFPVANRPFIARQDGPSMYYKTKEAERLVQYGQALALVDNLMERYPTDKGVVHTISKEISKFVVNNSSNAHRLVTHDTATRGQVAQDFIDSPDPLVMVSPSFGRGLDLKDDRGRFQAIMKIPYAGLGDKQTKARADDGERGSLWYSGLAAREIVQMTGRVTRSDTDWGRTYMVDKRFMSFYAKNRRHFPKYFQEAVTAMDQ